MATWTTPKTWSVNDLLTSADMDTYNRDNMNVGRGFVTAQLTSGNVSVSSTSWADVVTTIDLILPGAVNDVVQYSCDGQWTLAAGSEPLMAPRSTAGSNYWVPSTSDPGTGSGVLGMAGQADTGTSPFGGTAFRTLVSGDISGGNVTARLRARVSSATTQTLDATSGSPVTVYMVNRGPAVNV